MLLSTSNEKLPLPLLTTANGQGPTLAAGPTLCNLPLPGKGIMYQVGMLTSEMCMQQPEMHIYYGSSGASLGRGYIRFDAEFSFKI